MFFRGEEKDSAMEILDACGFHSTIGVKVLVQKSPITMSEEGRFDMHDLIQETGHYFVFGENPKNLEKHNRVWRRKDVVKICAMDAMRANDRIKALQIGLLWKEFPPSLPQVVATSLPREFQSMEHCCLQLGRSLVEQLWEGYKFPEIQTSMDNLVELSLRETGIEILPSSSIGQYCTNLLYLDLSLSQLPCLKFLNLSDCYNLVELPDLPPSIAILIANGCKSLKIVGDFSKNHLKWLWKVSFSASNCNCKEVLQSMLQGNATEDYFISFRFYGTCIPISGGKLGTFTLQLPLNWYNEFSGFLVYIDWDTDDGDVIIINDVLGGENEDVDNEETENVDNEETEDVANEETEDVDNEETMRADAVCYISFGSLRDTSWWNSAHTTISFFLRVDVYLKVELVPRRSQGDDSIERVKDTTYYSEFWDEESPNKKTFEIICDSGSSIEILFCHNLHSGMFDGI
ncbi:hypothetical protein OSB04_018695 [Centaurea solstitialis]|uniref:Disease resistance protein Roq1-like winged-helix domain-containing protein n=1 Tax=Centaurea solstitialis TaxID=347529 RepID=A0AA38TH67_9ASTR|nr:hypothetical protein OSB04_018695 [Centaurea solstitialis]